MKKFLMAFTALFFAAISTKISFANTIITAPIDSRPISIDYLNNLAEINGDTVLSVDKEILDIFPDDNKTNRFADSKKVREQIEKMVSENNSKDTTVILNTSTYITGGLVGSRCSINYDDYAAALSDMERLMSTYKEPTYYVNLSMPRTLPETRQNKIWSDEKSMTGLGSYYLKYNPKSDLAPYIRANFKNVNPTQFLMEWSYVENKKTELGENSLEAWEKDFLHNVNIQYKRFQPYSNYFNYYSNPYGTISTIFFNLIKLQDKGLLDEIVISNDDFQLPNFILYLYNNSTENDFIPTENSSPIKYSFARSFMKTGASNIYTRLIYERGQSVLKSALKGNAENINFIFGTDEVPQLIYARDVSKRRNLSTKIKTFSNSNSSSVAAYDVIGTDSLLQAAVNFVTYSKNKTDKQFDLYMYDYNSTSEKNASATLSNMKNSSEKNNIGLIEIFSNNTLNTGENTVFKKIMSTEYNEVNISDLSSYSAWNTNANAIGLGVAHTQVYGINEQKTENISEFLKAQLKMLNQHLFEDGIYTIQCKRALSNERYMPTEEDTINSPKLYSMLNPEQILSQFKDKKYNIKNETLEVEKIDLTKYSFPWKRKFDCFVDFEVTLK